MISSIMHKRGFVLGSCAVLLGLSGTAAKADTVIYNNLSTYTYYGYTPANAAPIGDTDYTALVADDINPAAGTAGVAINSISFSVVNFDSIDITFSPIVEVFSDDYGYPGTLLFQSQPGSVTAVAGREGVVTVASNATMFTTPDSTFFVGVIFSDATTAPVAPVTLNQLGLGIYNPPSVGSSGDEFFDSGAATSPGGDDPNGEILNFGGNPPANFGFELSGTSPAAVTPEPSSLSLLALGAASIGGFFQRTRRKA